MATLNNLITRADFKGIYTMPIAVNSQDEINLNNLIEQYQEQYLIELLGHAEYYKLLADCTYGEPGTQVYIDLLQGATMYINGLGTTFKGFKNALTGFVAFHYVRMFQTTLTMSGNMQLEGLQGRPAVYALTQKAVTYYNHAVYRYGVLNEINVPSCYTFLLANTASFPDWAFTEQKHMNLYNL